jgi:hypothetical protein
LKQRFRKLLLLLALWIGAQMGAPLSPEEIEELMRTMNAPKIVRKFAEEEEQGDDPLPTAGSRTF